MYHYPMMKTCNRCNETKDEEEFHWHTRSKGIRNAICKVCRKDQYKSWWNDKGGSEIWYEKQRVSREKRRIEMRQYVRDIKSKTPCADCGNIYHFAAMDFDHIEGGKIADVSTLVNKAMRTALMAELKKCELVCSNCHRVRTYERGELKSAGAEEQATLTGL